jgi:hypothetical protein
MKCRSSCTEEKTIRAGMMDPYNTLTNVVNDPRHSPSLYSKES